MMLMLYVVLLLAHCITPMKRKTLQKQVDPTSVSTVIHKPTALYTPERPTHMLKFTPDLSPVAKRNKVDTATLSSVSGIPTPERDKPYFLKGPVYSSFGQWEVTFESNPETVLALLLAGKVRPKEFASWFCNWYYGFVKVREAFTFLSENPENTQEIDWKFLSILRHPNVCSILLSDPFFVPNIDNQFLLYYLAYKDYAESLQLFMNDNRVNIIGHGNMAYRIAVKFNSAHTLNLLTKSQLVINQLFIDLASKGELKELYDLCSKHTSLLRTKALEQCALMAAFQNDYVMVSLILRIPEVDITFNDNTLLKNAAKLGYVEVLKILVNHRKCKYSQTALNTAFLLSVQAGHLETSMELTRFADISFQDNICLAEATRLGRMDLIMMIIFDLKFDKTSMFYEGIVSASTFNKLDILNYFMSFPRVPESTFSRCIKEENLFLLLQIFNSKHSFSIPAAQIDKAFGELLENGNIFLANVLMTEKKINRGNLLISYVNTLNDKFTTAAESHDQIALSNILNIHPFAIREELFEKAITDELNPDILLLYLTSSFAKLDIGKAKLVLDKKILDPSLNNNALIRTMATAGTPEMIRLLLADPRVDPTANDNEALIQAFLNNNIPAVHELQKDKRVLLKEKAKLENMGYHTIVSLAFNNNSELNPGVTMVEILNMEFELLKA